MTNVPPTGLRGAVDLSSLVNRPAAPAPGAAPAAAAGGAPIDVVVAVDDSSFGDILELSRTVPVVVDLWSARSEASTVLSELLERVLREYAGALVLARVEAETNPQLAQAFQVQAVPTVAAVVAGQPVQLFQGNVPEEDVRAVFDQLLQLAAQNGVTGRLPVDGAEPAAAPEPEPLPPLHQEAYDAIEAGDYARAVTAYKTAIAQNPADRDAVAGLAQVSLLHRLQGKTLDEIRSRAAASPDELDAQLDVADLDLSGGHIDDAFDRLLTFFVKLDPAGRTVVRERIVEYFEIVGADDPRVVAARRRLTNLLY
ncbi:tetratricopeptide repeat protein [Agromyces atrinae]|uniref:Putative thioredoxin n=1 Tax=Agromyces atrinae TaxID=592376 RepID=A0A4Q2MB28_9MICO|nr:tetratricopeptide repeat protein [Agromyces atrinae]MCI2958157.1 tetratricopeptide repeat protein [Agromyces atrinae]NYD66540.1 putative thioredoxin [Agromyces atrinae]RXZ87212.1 tetratricopeptide repeat protein [Agromyces atrinae]